MKSFLALLVLFTGMHTNAFAQSETPQQSLNRYMEFLDKSVEVLTSGF